MQQNAPDMFYGPQSFWLTKRKRRLLDLQCCLCCEHIVQSNVMCVILVFVLNCKTCHIIYTSVSQFNFLNWTFVSLIGVWWGEDERKYT